jgi:hypothetical protein
LQHLHFQLLFFSQKGSRLLGSSLNFVSVWSTCFFVNVRWEEFWVFFFLQSEVADGFHASIFVIRAVLQSHLSSFVRACFFGKSGVWRGMLHA